MNAEASCVGSCRWVATRLKKILAEHPGWASAALADSRSSELARLAARWPSGIVPVGSDSIRPSRR